MPQRLFSLLLFQFLFLNLFTQPFSPVLLDNWQQPPSIKLKQIKTPSFKVVYPDSLEFSALMVANYFENIKPYVEKTTVKTNRLEVLMHNQILESNAFATLSPRRIELFPVPPQGDFCGSNNWYFLTAIHEFRHITQFALFQESAASFYYYLFGPETFELLMMLSTPAWYFEGDAVCTETALTNSGRGRLSGFTAEHKALLAGGKYYSYEKVLFGSYRNWYPLDMPYSYGYLMMSDLRDRYGVNKIRNMTYRTGDGIIYPWRFSHSFKKVTGTNVRRYHRNLLHRLDSTLILHHNESDNDDKKVINKTETKNWQYNLFPKELEDGRVIILRYGQENVFQFVIIDPSTNTEKILYKSYFLNTDEPFSIAGNKMIWPETISDLRWGKRNYRVIKELNITTGKITTLISRSRYFSPAISPDGTKIATVLISESANYSLTILDKETCKVLKQYTLPENAYPQTPSWSQDGERIYFTYVTQPAGKGLSYIDVVTDSIVQLISPGNENFAYPVEIDDYLFFQAEPDGIDNIYAFSLKDSIIYKTSFSALRATHPARSFDGKNILYCELEKDGYAVYKKDINPAYWEKTTKYADYKNNTIIQKLTQQEAGFAITDSIKHSEYHTIAYNSFFSPSSFYRWGIGSIDSALNLSFVLRAKNLPNTMAAGITHTYNLIEKTHLTSFDASYGKYYTIVDFGLSSGSRTGYNINDYQANKDTSFYYSWQEEMAYGGLRLPLNFSRGRFVQNISLSTYLSYFHSRNSSFPAVVNGTYIPVHYSIDFSRYTMWLRDIKPHWGQVIKANAIHSPFPNKSLYPDLFSLRGDFYFPAFFAHHSIALETGFEKQLIDLKYYNPILYHRSYLRFSRGYPYAFPAEKTIKAGANYCLPIFYPDFNFLTILYSKRIVLNLFYDFTQLQYTFYQGKYNFRSYGIELTSETFLARWPIPFIIGVRYSQQLDFNKDKMIELIFTLNQF